MREKGLRNYRECVFGFINRVKAKLSDKYRPTPDNNLPPADERVEMPLDAETIALIGSTGVFDILSEVGNGPADAKKSDDRSTIEDEPKQP